jgi:hypothetical protein
VLAYVDTQRPVAKFNDRGGEGSVLAGLRAAAGELAEMTFDDSEGWEESVHGRRKVSTYQQIPRHNFLDESLRI